MEKEELSEILKDIASDIESDKFDNHVSCTIMNKHDHCYIILNSKIHDSIDKKAIEILINSIEFLENSDVKVSEMGISVIETKRLSTPRFNSIEKFKDYLKENIPLMYVKIRIEIDRSKLETLSKRFKHLMMFENFSNDDIDEIKEFFTDLEDNGFIILISFVNNKKCLLPNEIFIKIRKERNSPIYDEDIESIKKYLHRFEEMTNWKIENASFSTYFGFDDSLCRGSWYHDFYRIKNSSEIPSNVRKIISNIYNEHIPKKEWGGEFRNGDPIVGRFGYTPKIEAIQFKFNLDKS